MFFCILLCFISGTCEGTKGDKIKNKKNKIGRNLIREEGK